MKGLKGQGQPCSEPLKFVLKILRILKKWDWAQGMVHQNKNNSLLFFAFVLEKQEKETLFLAEKNKKHQRNKSLALFCVIVL